jgi:hypothetical protein
MYADSTVIRCKNQITKTLLSFHAVVGNGTTEVRFERDLR